MVYVWFIVVNVIWSISEWQEPKRGLPIEVSLFYIFIIKVDDTRYWSSSLKNFPHFNHLLGEINSFHPARVLNPTFLLLWQTQQIKIPSFPSQMKSLDLELFLLVQLMPLWFGICLISLVFCFYSDRNFCCSEMCASFSLWLMRFEEWEKNKELNIWGLIFVHYSQDYQRMVLWSNLTKVGNINLRNGGYGVTNYPCLSLVENKSPKVNLFRSLGMTCSCAPPQGGW